ncbi:MAG TPA: hypothetical protein VGN64_09205 [Dyadobacter sp.]|jgi:hypothetical protein|nr:hypothetical protein [Dyadobacter sp.]
MSPTTVAKSLTGVKISDQNLKIILYILGGVIIYFLVTGKIRQARSASQYQKAGTDPNTNYAISIHQACNPTGVDWLINFDGTFENDLMLLADQISNVDKVAAAYLKLYNEIMYERLEKELSSAKYQEWIRRAQASPTTAPIPGSVADLTVLYALRDTIVYSDVDSTKIAKYAKAGATIGKKLNTMLITVKGVKKIYYLVSWKTWGLLHNQGLVLAADVRTTIEI